MKKFLLSLFSLILVLSLLTVFVGCDSDKDDDDEDDDEVEDCVHEYDNACDKKCNLCGEKRKVDGHVYSSACDEECNECGAENKDAEEHEYFYDCDEECDRCGKVREVDNHEYDNSCDRDCNVCGKVREDAGHVYDNACDNECNECGEGRVTEAHVYDNACDETCNECGELREAEPHVYDNGCDDTCNVCSDVRAVEPHIYDNACDATCNECGLTRTVEPHVYDNTCDATCNECGEIREGAGHVYIKANDTECSVCGGTRVLLGSGDCGSTYPGDGVVWGLDTDGTLTISGEGAMRKIGSTCWAKMRDKIKHLVIKEGVTTVSEEAFWCCSSMVSVELPETLTHIQKSAFDGCTRLASVYLPDSLEFIGEFAFDGCASLVSVRIGTGLETISNYAFNNCYKLVEVIDNSSINIKGGFHYLTYYSKKIHTGASEIVKQGDFLFYTYDDVNYLIGYVGFDSSLTLPESYNGEKYKVHDYALYSAFSLSSVTVPKTVTYIGANAFGGTRIDYIYFEEAYGWWTSSEPDATDGTDIDVSDPYNTAYYITGSKSGLYWRNGRNGSCGAEGNEENVSWELSADGTLTISGTGQMADYALLGDVTNAPWEKYRSNIARVVIEDGVTNAGAYLAYSCPSLTDIDFGSDVTFIGDYAFAKCTGLEDLILGENIVTIGNNAFESCRGIRSLKLTNTITEIRENAFANCIKLVEIFNYSTIALELNSAYNGMVTYYALEIRTDEGESRVERVGDYYFFTVGDSIFLFDYVGTEKDLTLPESHNGNRYSINASTFEYSDITSVVIPSAVIEIGDYAFATMSLKNVTISHGVERIGDGTFMYTKISSISVPDSVYSLGAQAFSHSSYLESVYLGNGLVHIGEQIFYDTYYYSRSSNWNGSILITNGYLVGTQFTLSGTCSIPYGVKLIADGAFSWCDNLTSIYIPETVQYIGEGPFWGCSLLETIDVSTSNPYYCSIDGNLYSKDGTVLIEYASGKLDPVFVIPEGVTTIKRLAFSYAYHLVSVTVPESVVMIDRTAFNQCYKLIEIVNHSSIFIEGYHATPTPDVHSGESKVISYQGYLFTTIDRVDYLLCAEDPSNAVDIILPVGYGNGGYVIADYAFNNLKNLKSVVIPDEVTAIGENAFRYCTSLESVRLSENTARIGYGAFAYCVNIASIKIPVSVTEMSSDIFYYCNAIIINCEVSSKPEGWSDTWCPSGCTVYWNS